MCKVQVGIEHSSYGYHKNKLLILPRIIVVIFATLRAPLTFSDDFPVLDVSVTVLRAPRGEGRVAVATTQRATATIYLGRMGGSRHVIEEWELHSQGNVEFHMFQVFSTARAHIGCLPIRVMVCFWLFVLLLIYLKLLLFLGQRIG